MCNFKNRSYVYLNLSINMCVCQHQAYAYIYIYSHTNVYFHMVSEYYLFELYIAACPAIFNIVYIYIMYNNIKIYIYVGSTWLNYVKLLVTMCYTQQR